MDRFGGCVTSARRRTCGTSKGSCRTSTGADPRGWGRVRCGRSALCGQRWWTGGTWGRPPGVLSAFDGVGVLLGRGGAPGPWSHGAAFAARVGLGGQLVETSVDGRSRCPAQFGSSSGSVRGCLKSLPATVFLRTCECVRALLRAGVQPRRQAHVALHTQQVRCARLTIEKRRDDRVGAARPARHPPPGQTGNRWRKAFLTSAVPRRQLHRSSSRRSPGEHSRASTTESRISTTALGFVSRRAMSSVARAGRASRSPSRDTTPGGRVVRSSRIDGWALRALLLTSTWMCRGSGSVAPCRVSASAPVMTDEGPA